MAKLTAWLVTIIGIVLVLRALEMNLGALVNNWLIPVSVLVIGIGKLIRNYSAHKKK